VIRVLVVDDHPFFREGLVFELSRVDDIEVIGEAENGLRARELALEGRPHVVILDLSMPVMDGLTALPTLVAAGAQVLILTLSQEDTTVLASVRAGASGYLVKGESSDRLIAAVRAVADGHAIFGSGLASRLLTPQDPELPELSSREREVLEHLAKGLTNLEIADALVIAPVTVRNHVSAILAKLQVTNRTQAVLRLRGQARPE
jgi:DNA-binding NarL/FixJ family response regulator